MCRALGTWRRRLALACAWLVLATSAAAQTIAGDRFTLNLGPCTMRSGAGNPAPTLGKVCDTYVDTGTGAFWMKTAAGGWVQPGGLAGAGTADRIARWATSTTLGTSSIADDLTNVLLSPSANVYFTPGGLHVLPGAGYVYNLGHISNKYLAVHAAELWVETLVAQNTMATIGGRLMIAPTNILTRDYLAAASGPLCVKYNSFKLHVGGVELGSKLVMQSAGKFETFYVQDGMPPTVTAQGDYCYTVTRNADGTGTNDWYAGDAVLDTGKIGDGFIDLYSLSSLGSASAIGPTIVGNLRTGALWNEWATRWAIGNLNGLYGYGAGVYGAVFGKPGGPLLSVDDTNGLRMFDGLGVLRVHITPAGGAAFTGDGSGVTAINGGNITTRTITGDKLVANTITVGELNATGFGDNAIKNGAFEGTTPLAGWVKGASSSTAPIVASCCGTNGPGTLFLDSGDGSTYLSTVYLATPVVPGQVYRVAFKVYATATSATAMHVILFESTSTGSGVRRVLISGAASPDVVSNSNAFLCTSCGVTVGWEAREYTYTPAAGVYWASLAIYNISGTYSATPYAAMHLDDFEMQKQIGTGHILANSISANLLQANAVTAGKIAARSISADRLVVGTLTGTEIAATTISGGHIIGSSISADKLNVTSLSAISANLGTVNAGTINGVTINGTTINGSNFTGGNIDLPNASGALFHAGSDGAMTAKLAVLGQSMSGGTSVFVRGRADFDDSASALYMRAGTGIVIEAGGGGFYMNANQFRLSGLSGGFHVCSFNAGSYYYLYGCPDNTLLEADAARLAAVAPAVAALTKRLTALEALVKKGGNR
jgi:hypothetical protein